MDKTNHLIESVEVMSFAEQKCEIRRFILVEVQQIDLAVAVFALRAMPVKFRAVQVYLRVHCIHCFGAYLREYGISKTFKILIGWRVEKCSRYTQMS